MTSSVVNPYSAKDANPSPLWLYYQGAPRLYIYMDVYI